MRTVRRQLARIIRQLRQADLTSWKLVCFAWILLGCTWTILIEMRHGFGIVAWHPRLLLHVDANQGLSIALPAAGALLAMVSSAEDRTRSSADVIRDGNMLAIVAILAIGVATDAVLTEPGLASLAVLALTGIVAVWAAAPRYREAVRRERTSVAARRAAGRRYDERVDVSYLRGGGLADAVRCWVACSAVPLVLIVGCHLAGWMSGDGIIDALQSLALSTAVCLVVCSFAVVARQAQLAQAHAVQVALAIAAVLLGALMVVGQVQITLSSASGAGKVFAAVWVAGLFGALPWWRAWFVNASLRPGRAMTLVDAILLRCL